MHNQFIVINLEKENYMELILSDFRTKSCHKKNKKYISFSLSMKEEKDHYDCSDIFNEQLIKID